MRMTLTILLMSLVCVFTVRSVDVSAQATCGVACSLPNYSCTQCIYDCGYQEDTHTYWDPGCDSCSCEQGWCYMYAFIDDTMTMPCYACCSDTLSRCDGGSICS